MVPDARQLGEEHAQILRADRHLEVEQLLDREHIAVLHAHRRAIIEPVEIGQRLQIGLVLDQLLGAAVEQADVRIDPLDDLAVELHHQPQHAVRRRVLRAEVDRVVGDRRRRRWSARPSLGAAAISSSTMSARLRSAPACAGAGSALGASGAVALGSRRRLGRAGVRPPSLASVVPGAVPVPRPVCRRLRCVAGVLAGLGVASALASRRSAAASARPSASGGGIGLLVARQHIVRAFPRAHEVEACGNPAPA